MKISRIFVISKIIDFLYTVDENAIKIDENRGNRGEIMRNLNFHVVEQTSVQCRQRQNRFEKNTYTVRMS